MSKDEDNSLDFFLDNDSVNSSEISDDEAPKIIPKKTNQKDKPILIPTLPSKKASPQKTNPQTNLISPTNSNMNMNMNSDFNPSLLLRTPNSLPTQNTNIHLSQNLIINPNQFLQQNSDNRHHMTTRYQSQSQPQPQPQPRGENPQIDTNFSAEYAEQNVMDYETAQLLAKMNFLKRQNNLMNASLIISDSDSEIESVNSSSAPEKVDPNSKTVTFEEPITEFSQKVSIHPDEFLSDIIKKFPSPYNTYQLLIDGITFDPKECPLEMIDDEAKVTLVKPSDPFEGQLKITFCLPSKEKKHFAVKETTTFKDIANKLGLKQCLFTFDGDIFQLNQKVQDAGLEDGDQVDVIVK